MVEFLLVLFPLIVLVGGVIQLGIGISHWHDLNRIANEGARFAAVNEWPDCPATETTCTGNPPCNAQPATLRRRSLANYLRCEATDAGLPSSVGVTICSPAGTATFGEPVTVRLTSRFNYLSLNQDGSNGVSWLGADIRGEATMRVERPPTKYTASGC
jgi:hypothetical protein